MKFNNMNQAILIAVPSLAIGVILSKPDIAYENAKAGKVTFKNEEAELYSKALSEFFINGLKYYKGNSKLESDILEMSDLNNFYYDCVHPLLTTLFDGSELINKYPVIKKEVMQDIVNNDLDILNISAESIAKRFLFLPQVRKEFINFISEIVDDEDEGLEISNEEKKKLLSLLLSLSFVNDEFCPSAMDFIKKVSTVLKIEESEIDEMIKPVQDIHLARKNLNKILVG